LFCFLSVLSKSAFICVHLRPKIISNAKLPSFSTILGACIDTENTAFFPKFLNLHNFYNVWLNQINRNADIDIGKVF